MIAMKSAIIADPIPIGPKTAVASPFGSGKRYFLEVILGRRRATLLYIPTLAAWTLPLGAYKALRPAEESLDRRRVRARLRHHAARARRLGQRYPRQLVERAIAELGT